MKMPPNLQCTPAQAELQAALGALTFPTPSLAGDMQTWVACCFLDSDLGPPTHASEHGMLGRGQGQS